MSGVFWIDNVAEESMGVQVGGGVLTNVHDPAQCAGEFCAMHNPSDHHMRSWPSNWRGDRHLMERICPHGIGHPDPDDIAFKVRRDPIDGHYEAVHGCDGCCGTPPP